MIPSGWTPHHRSSDGECVGYLALEGDDVTPMSLLGEPLAPATDWVSAEQVLEELGLSWLAEPLLLTTDDGPARRVVVVEVDREKVVVCEADNALVVGRPADLVGRTVLELPTDRLRRP